MVQSELFGTQCLVKLGLVSFGIFIHILALWLNIHFVSTHADGIPGGRGRAAQCKLLFECVQLGDDINERRKDETKCMDTPENDKCEQYVITD